MTVIDLTGRDPKSATIDVQLAAGQRVELRASAVPSSGHVWDIQHTPEGVIADHPFLTPAGEQARIGAPRVCVMRFRAAKGVRGDIVVAYKRRFEADPVSTVTLRINELDRAPVVAG